MNPNRLKTLFDLNRDAPRRYEVQAKDETADVYVYDIIGGWGISGERFAKDVAAITAKTIHLFVNSPGGEVPTARAMMAALRRHEARVIAHVDGLAASAASLLLLAADEVEMAPSSFQMIHNPWALTVGDADDHRNSADLLDKYGEGMVRDYADRSGQTAKKVRQWMSDETWFDAEEAVANGFADRVTETESKAQASWNLAAFFNAPSALTGAADHGAKPALIAAAAATDVPGSAPDDQTVKEVSDMDPTKQTGQTPAPDLEAIRAQAQEAERKRVSEINRIGLAAKMPGDAIQAAIGDGTTIEAWKDKVLAQMVEASQQNDTRVGAAAATITVDAADKRRDSMVAAVLHRINPAKNTVDGQNPFRAMSCLRMAEESLVQAGVSVRGLTPGELAIKAMQKTSDFANVLENSARKMLLAAYELATPSYKVWTKPSTTPDFKTMSRARLSETPAFLVVPEGAQITIATMSDSKETYALATYGRGVSFTRQMLINDDLGAFNDLIRAFGLQAAIIENKTVYSILNTNGNMADGAALFVAGHANLGTGVIGDTALDAGYAAMRKQTGLDGVSILNIEPKFLIVPVAKEITAKRAMLPVDAGVKATDRNMFAGRFQVVADAELDGTSTVVWYFAADPAIYPGIEYAHLEGATGPQIIRQENENGILGVNLYAFLDFGAKAVDWRPLYKSSGA